MSTDKLSIGIAGAGIAGLTAGILLQEAGHTVQIFESRSKPGGRIQSLMVNGYLIEAGPEFVHGNSKETMRLLKKYQIPFEPANGKMYHAGDEGLTETHDVVAGWDKLLDKMKLLERDIPFAEFLIKNFPGNHFHELRKSAIRFAEGFDLADIQLAGTRGLAREWAVEESGQYRIHGGYGTLIRSMEKEFNSLGGKILFQHVMETVVWHSDEIRVNVCGDHSFIMDKLVISLPISMLNQSAPVREQLLFYPSLDIQQRAFVQIGFGTVIKIVMIWESVFWNILVPGAQFIFSDCFIPTWWTPYPQDLPLLTGWLGGPAAARLSNEPDEFFLEKALESLSSIFSVPVHELKNRLEEFRIFNWENEPWSRGAYSYPRVESEQAKTVCRKSVDGRIYFAGEAFYEGPCPGTVEAAVISGLDAARLLLTELK
jgi:monoamine oxidase